MNGSKLGFEGTNGLTLGVEPLEERIAPTVIGVGAGVGVGVGVGIGFSGGGCCWDCHPSCSS